MAFPAVVPVGATAAILPGALGGIYRNTTQVGDTEFNATPSHFGTPTWADQVIVKDVKPTWSWDFAEALSRETPVKLSAKTQIDLGCQITMRADPSNSDYLAWVNAAFSRARTLDLLILNQKITTPGALGVRGEFLISLSDEAEEIAGAVYATFDLKSTRTPNGVPRWAMVTAVAAGPPAVPTVTYTDITYTT